MKYEILKIWNKELLEYLVDLRKIFRDRMIFEKGFNLLFYSLNIELILIVEWL